MHFPSLPPLAYDIYTALWAVYKLHSALSCILGVPTQGFKQCLQEECVSGLFLAFGHRGHCLFSSYHLSLQKFARVVHLLLTFLNGELGSARSSFPHKRLVFWPEGQCLYSQPSSSLQSGTFSATIKVIPSV